MGVVYERLYTLLLDMLLLFVLEISIEKCFSVPRDHLAMTGTKDPTHFVVIIYG